MGENKGQTIFLSVIGIATLLVAIIGLIKLLSQLLIRK